MKMLARNKAFIVPDFLDSFNGWTMFPIGTNSAVWIKTFSQCRAIFIPWSNENEYRIGFHWHIQTFFSDSLSLHSHWRSSCRDFKSTSIGTSLTVFFILTEDLLEGILNRPILIPKKRYFDIVKNRRATSESRAPRTKGNWTPLKCLPRTWIIDWEGRASATCAREMLAACPVPFNWTRNGGDFND